MRLPVGINCSQPGRVGRMTKKRSLAAASIVAGAAVIGALTLSAGKKATAAARPLAVGSTRVQKRTLSAMVSQGGILTYQARSDGSPYAVLDQAKGTYTRLPAV